jgi:hypothetical protein
MDASVDFDDQWLALLASLPLGFDLDHRARRLGAFGRARQVKDPAALLRLALAYGGCGMSLRQTCAWAAETGLAEISDPALRGGRYDAVRTRCQGHQLAPACRLRFDGRSG